MLLTIYYLLLTPCQRRGSGDFYEKITYRDNVNGACFALFRG